MRKALIAVIVASALFAVGAFAANFTTSAEDVASGRDSVVACAPAIDVVFPPAQWDDTEKRYEITGATIRFVAETGDATTVDGCNDLSADWRIELNGADQEGTTTVAAGVIPVTSDGSPGLVNGWPVSDIEGAAVLIEDILITSGGVTDSFGAP